MYRTFLLHTPCLEQLIETLPFSVSWDSYVRVFNEDYFFFLLQFELKNRVRLIDPGLCLSPLTVAFKENIYYK